MILAWNRYTIDLHFIESKLYYPFNFTKAISDVAFVENCFLIIAFENESFITIYNWENFLEKKVRRVKLLGCNAGNIKSLCIVDNDHLLSGSYDSMIKLWKISTLECIWTYVDTTIRIWDLRSGLCLKTFIGHQNYPIEIQETKNGEIVSLDREGVLNFWDQKTGAIILSLTNSLNLNDFISCFRILESGDLVTGSENGLIQMWSNEPIFFSYFTALLEDKEKGGTKRKECNIL
ncbi:unnamed protein product [Brachionus calyciflorus]|uniref:Uncharacterized protein n=1 Tax=Brachionus calyciflorus TaxID=104777 RepID=A0A814JIB8_9BILA|nr:unnamed protein product [Brachionus calyciflorus]